MFVRSLTVAAVLCAVATVAFAEDAEMQEQYSSLEEFSSAAAATLSSSAAATKNGVVEVGDAAGSGETPRPTPNPTLAPTPAPTPQPIPVEAQQVSATLESNNDLDNFTLHLSQYLAIDEDIIVVDRIVRADAVVVVRPQAVTEPTITWHYEGPTAANVSERTATLQRDEPNRFRAATGVTSLSWSPPETPTPPPSSPSKKLNPGIIVAIVLAIVAVALVAAIVAYKVLTTRRKSGESDDYTQLELQPSPPRSPRDSPKPQPTPLQEGEAAV